VSHAINTTAASSLSSNVGENVSSSQSAIPSVSNEVAMIVPHSSDPYDLNSDVEIEPWDGVILLDDDHNEAPSMTMSRTNSSKPT
jgi:hypothetical protein